MKLVISALGMTSDRAKQLLDELSAEANNDIEESAISTFITVAEGKATGEILFLGAVMKAFINKAAQRNNTK